jgi:hypothetical protein
MATQQGNFERIIRRLNYFDAGRTISATPTGARAWVVLILGEGSKYGELAVTGNARIWVKIGRRGVPGNPHELTSHTDAIEAADVVLDWLDGKTE